MFALGYHEACPTSALHQNASLSGPNQRDLLDAFDYLSGHKQNHPVTHLNDDGSVTNYLPYLFVHNDQTRSLRPDTGRAHLRKGVRARYGEVQMRVLLADLALAANCSH